MNLTTKFLDALTPTGARAEYADAIVRGLTLRLAADGSKTWTLRYRNATGERRRLTLGNYPDITLKQARAMAALERGKIATGQDPAKVKRIERAAVLQTPDTIGRLVADYMTHHAKKHKRSWKADERMFAVEVLPLWEDRIVRNLTRRDVRALIEAIADRGAPYTANLCLAIVRKLLNFGISRDWVDANVASLIQKPGVVRTRDRVLTEDEIRRVWAACAGERPSLCALLRLRLITAQRGGELAQIKWSYISGDWLTLPGEITKNKKAHRVPLTKMAIDLLDSLPRFADEPWIFPDRTGSRPLSDSKHTAPRIRERVLASYQQADPVITTFEFRAHDLRRTAATYMAEAGIPPADIARVLNHAEGGPSATQIYNRYVYDREKRIALETWERRLIAILAHTEKSAVLPFIAHK